VVRRSSGTIARVSRHHIKTATKKRDRICGPSSVSSECAVAAPLRPAARRVVAPRRNLQLEA